MENRITIKVTAQAKNTKTYTIVVSREAAKNLQLSSLSIADVKLSPEFSSDIYNYETEITTSEFKKLDISAITNSQNAEIEVIGNEPESFKYASFHK